MNACMLPKFGSCCCNCRWHVEDFHHCTTARDLREQTKKCVCGEHKGWICMAPEDRAHSGWSEHGMCEMHEAKP
jgi:hypothetical protein